MGDQPLRQNAFVESQTRRVQSAALKKGLLKKIDRSSRYYWVRLLLENPSAMLGLGFVLTIAVAAFAVPALVPHDPFLATPVNRFQSPSLEHPFGTDSLGRDLMARAAHGARTSLMVGLSVMICAAMIGSVIGLVAGYYQRLDTAIMRVIDGIMAFPGLVLAIAIMASLGPSARNVVIALTVSYIPVVARLVRGSTLSIKNHAYVEAARAIGVPDFILLRRHIFMNALTPIIVQGTFIVAFAIIAEASLSFLGAGVHPETPTWGNMLRAGQLGIHHAWYSAVFPGVLLFLTVLAINMVGDGLRDALDPRSRQR